MRKFAAFVLILFLAPLATPAASGSELRKNAVVRAVESAGPSVVNVSTEMIVQRSSPFGNIGDPFFDQFFKDFFEGPRPRQYTRTSLGSGVIIRSDGTILTNEHVILRASKITVTLLDGREFEAAVVGSDPSSDLAVLKIEAGNLPAIRMGQSADLMIGEPAIAIGNPFGLSHTVTAGVVSALHRSFRTDEGRVYSDFIQTDASINPGNSGGPLLNIDGELIGINSAIYSKAQGIGFAIPVDRAQRIVDNLINYGKVRHGWIGLRVSDLTPETAKATGVRQGHGANVKMVFPGSPAADAGIEIGDVITGIGQIPIDSLDQYRAAILNVTVGSRIKMTGVRSGRQFARDMTAIELPASAAEQIAWQVLGVSVVPNSPKVSKSYGLTANEGMVISKVRVKSPAGHAGIQPGDLLLAIGGQRLKTLQDYYHACAALRLAENAVIVVQRQNRAYYLSLQLD